MNFLVLASDGKAIARPDSTRNKDNGDCFVPDGVEVVGYAPVIYARMCRTGKAIGREFASRYYDAIGFGILLYPSEDNGEQPHFCRAVTSIYDKTSLLPMAMYNPITLEQGGNVFDIRLNGKEIFSCNTMGMSARIADALAICSTNTTIHKGDFILAELDVLKTLCSRSDGGSSILAHFCGNETIDIDLKF